MPWQCYTLSVHGCLQLPYCFYYHFRVLSASGQAEPICISSTRKKSRWFNLWKVWSAPMWPTPSSDSVSKGWGLHPYTRVSVQSRHFLLLFSLPSLFLMPQPAQCLSCGWCHSVGRESTGCQYLLLNCSPVSEAWLASNGRKVASGVRTQVELLWRGAKLWVCSQGLTAYFEQNGPCSHTLSNQSSWPTLMRSC